MRRIPAYFFLYGHLLFKYVKTTHWEGKVFSNIPAYNGTKGVLCMTVKYLWLNNCPYFFTTKCQRWRGKLRAASNLHLYYFSNYLEDDKTNVLPAMLLLAGFCLRDTISDVVINSRQIENETHHQIAREKISHSALLDKENVPRRIHFCYTFGFVFSTERKNKRKLKRFCRIATEYESRAYIYIEERLRTKQP